MGRFKLAVFCLALNPLDTEAGSDEGGRNGKLISCTLVLTYRSKPFDQGSVECLRERNAVKVLGEPTKLSDVSGARNGKYLASPVAGRCCRLLSIANLVPPSKNHVALNLRKCVLGIHPVLAEGVLEVVDQDIEERFLEWPSNLPVADLPDDVIGKQQLFRPRRLRRSRLGELRADPNPFLCNVQML